MDENISRKNFLAGGVVSAAGVIGALSIPNLITSCSGSERGSGSTSVKGAVREFVPVEMLPKAVDGKPLKAALIGCGGRGTGALLNFLEAGDNLSIVAIADVFAEKVTACQKMLSDKGVDVNADMCFVGLDAYKEIMNTDADIVFLCTPPYFRPIHFKAAVDAGKHIFNEKPCAVDAWGVKTITLASRNADMKGLCVISGLVRRSQKDCIATYEQVCAGMIGEITGANVIRNGGALWARKRKPEWSDMEYMLKNWVNFNWLSGDHITEQFVHEIDQMYWFMGRMPVSALGYGGRQRRETGDMYDNFSIRYNFDNGVTGQCSTRQINGCTNGKSVLVYGTKGYTDCSGKIFNYDGSIKWQYSYPKKGDPDQSMAVKNPFVQEHIRLITAIRRGEKLNDTSEVANTTLLALMGRDSAYTGRVVTTEEALASSVKLGPESLTMGKVEGVEEVIPRAGIPSVVK